MKFISVPHEGDPSDIHQRFTALTIKPVCCRYWYLTHWESRDMSFPYWRLYWNKNEGATISYQGRVYPMLPESVYLISPCTPFSSNLRSAPEEKSEYLLLGERLTPEDSEEELVKHGHILHLFIHFNLGLSFDSVQPGIYKVSVHDAMRERLEHITRFLPSHYEVFDLKQNLDLHILILEALSKIPEQIWNSVMQDRRILHILERIENNIGGDLSNRELARHAGMALNSFIRKFSSEMGISPQSFVEQKRLEHAEIALQYTNDRIENIARDCGYRDRFYFTRAFKKIKKITPAAYRRLYQHEQI
jgi:AraC-like DNA-binding protein